VKKLRISIVQYLNTAPLVWGFTRGHLQGKYDLSFTVPSLCAEALRNGDADVAIIPAIEVQRIDDLAILPDLAIASKGRVRSLLLISKLPIENARSIALDSSSRSTQALTKILCARLWKTTPQFLEASPDLSAMLQQTDAALLIGDPALRLSVAIENSAQRGPSGEQVCSGAAASAAVAGAGSPRLPDKLHVYDVVEEWRKLANLPAVLAVWAARRAIVTPELAADFLASRDSGLQHIPEICAEAAPQLHLPESELRVYLEKNIDYSLDCGNLRRTDFLPYDSPVLGENLQGLLTFFRESADLGLIPRFNPISIAGRADLLAVGTTSATRGAAS
jgi:chorismate dehydratase